MMQLEMPTEVMCPLCRLEKTQLQENKSGNPYFQCMTFNSIVNLRPGENNDRAESVLAECMDDADDGTLEEPEEPESNEEEQAEATEGQSLNDLLSKD